MNATINFTVNGESRSVTTDPQRPLLDVLREEFHLTGTKYGCGEGQCRACSVLVNGKSISSCITPISSVDQQSVLTIEGVAMAKKLHPVQEAFLAERAFQCGYCTAGMIIGAVSLLKETPAPSDADIRSHLQGHICRCGTYPRIIKAIHRLAAQSGARP